MMHIRQASSQDAGTLAEFNSAIAFETEQLKLRPEVIRAGVEALLARPEYGFYLVAEVDDQIVASLMVTNEWSDWRNGMFWWIQSVYVRPAYRRRGIYRALYQHVKSLAEKADVCGFRLYVERENEIAQQTYASLGMAKTPYRIFEELGADVDFAEPE